jgi:S1-C subfamily serine protease
MDGPGQRRSRWRRRGPPVETTTICPRCRTAGPLRLGAGEVCGGCRSNDAWSRLGREPLVIDRDTIEEAVRRRQRDAAGRPLWQRMLVWLAPALALGVAALAGWTLVRLLSARDIGPLALLLAGMASAWKQALLAGIAAVVVGSVALVRTRRSRHFRHLGLLACHLVVIAVGGTAVALAALHGFASGSFDGEHTTMPPRSSLDLPPHLQRIVEASAVVLAPGADGDARAGALGTGVVVATDAHRAWIATCSHVAIPYVSTGAPRRPRDARAVWVQLSDGREGRAAVKWAAPPPLDVVLIELAVDRPPSPVPIALDASGLARSSAVSFVPNPYRSGWKVHHGQVIRRETHHTPAGEYDLVLTDLPVTFGDSGSGLFDARGQLVGLNTWTRIDGDLAQGVSLPTEAMRIAIEAIRTGRLDQLEHAE